MRDKNTIGIIGFGNMGSAIAQRVRPFYDVFVCDQDKNKTQNLEGINVAEGTTQLLSRVTAAVLAVKPQDFAGLLDEIKDHVHGKLIITIAAGITTAYIQKHLSNARVVRVMPNLPAKIGKGMSCLCKGEFATEEDLKLAEQLFKVLGNTLVIDEDMMDAATAISGSGPGFFYDFIENQAIDYDNFPEDIKKNFSDSLIRAAKTLNFDDENARTLVQATVAGSIALLRTTRLSPSDLKGQIASKGGTTEAGLEVLHKGQTLEEAVKAAAKRAKELSDSIK